MHNIAVVSLNKNKYSETFIRYHAEFLPASGHYFYGGYLPAFYSNGNSFLPFIKNENVLTNIISELIKKIRPQTFINAISEYCIKNNIKAILAHYGPVGLNMVEVSKKTGIPLFVYFHGYDVYRASELEVYGKYYYKIFQQAAHVFAVSKDMVAQLEKLGAPASKIVYSPCGANTDLFKPIDASENPPIFISVGRFDDTKNHEATIMAFSEVNKIYPETKLKLIGDGKNLVKCKKLTENLGLSAKIDFTGALKHEAVASEMAKARVFVLHSVTTEKGDKEGAPVSIMEAGASGLPVVATRHAGIGDIVLENETGFLIEENDVNAMGKCMIRFIENPFLAKQMGEKGALRINSIFSLNQNVSLVWRTINEHI